MASFNQQSETYTLFTKNTSVSSASGTKEVFPGIEARWTLARITLQTAGGNVVIGFRQDLNPPGSGKGRQLVVGELVEIYVPPGQRLYYASDSVQRVAVSIEPVPWLQQILLGMSELMTLLVPKKAPTPAQVVGGQPVTGGRLIPGWKNLPGITRKQQKK